MNDCPFCGEALRALAEMFTESVHETWTREEVVNIIEDAIRMGSPLAGPAPSAWQPIATAPKDGTEILLWGNCHPSNSPARYAKDANVGWWESDHWTTRVGGEQCDALLWMPIPDPCDKYGEPLFLPTALPSPDRGGAIRSSAPQGDGRRVSADDLRAAIEALGYDLRLREFATRTHVGIRNFNERCEALAALLAKAALSAPPSGALEALEPFAAISLVRDTDPNGLDMIDAPDLAITPNDVRRARAALTRPQPGGAVAGTERGSPAPDLYKWPVGCHSPNSCSRNGRCMYVGCRHDGADITALSRPHSAIIPTSWIEDQS